jgi:hypothetical protein
LVVLFAVLAVGVAGAAQRSVFSARPKRLVVPASAFKISSPRLRWPLRPGASQALDLRLTNPRRFVVAITNVRAAVVVDRAHARAGCNGGRDFRWIDMPSGMYPIRVGARRTVTLRRLGVRVLPRVAMIALPLNQDACKGARLTLRFDGRARRWIAGSRR